MNIENQYLDLLKDILQNGISKGDRTGTGTLSVFGRQIRHKMSEGFPLLTTKKMAWKQIVTELIWFLRGDTNIKFLLDNDCHIWDGDCYKKYSDYTNKIIEAYKELSIIGSQSEFDKIFKTKDSLEILSKSEFIDKIKNDEQFGSKWGELGPIYGKQWRKWGEWYTIGENKKVLREGVDQIKNLIKDLKENPDSRRLLVSAWNVGEIENMTLPPCHYGFQVYTKELTLKERFDLWEKLPNKDVMDFPIGKLTDEQYHDVLTQIGVPERSISLMYNTRSQDVPLGTPFNIASYALLLEIFGKMVNMVPDELISNMGDCHIYLNQIDGIKEQIQREPYPLPKLKLSKSLDFENGVDDFLKTCSASDFTIDNYEYHPTIKMPLSN